MVIRPFPFFRHTHFALSHTVYVICVFTLLSCSDTPRQYYAPPQASPNRMIEEAPILFTQPSAPDGGKPFYQKPELSTEQKDILTRKNSLVPIGYQDGSIANINMKTEYEESTDILNFNYAVDGQYVYAEGIVIIWRNDPPRTPRVIFVIPRYQGTMDFGPWIGDIRVGQSFKDQFSTGVKDISQDEKAAYFITSLYKHLENKEENCLENQKCQLSVNPQGNYIIFVLPRMIFLFGNNERRNLVQISIVNDDDAGCFKGPFDLLNTKFFCGQSDDGLPLTVNLGDSYKEVIEKANINHELPIIYTNDHLIQYTNSTTIGWKRNNYEEKPKNIPETSFLSFVLMQSYYTLPFLFDNSLIKININDSNEVQLQLDPINPEEKQKWTIEDINKKRRQNQPETAFYLSTDMPQIKRNYILQKNLIKSLLDFLEEKYKNFYSDAAIDAYLTEDSRILTALTDPVKFYKRIYGEYNDKYALEASGILIIDSEENTLAIEVTIDDPSGNTRLSVSTIDNSFDKYIIQNQEPFDLSQSNKTLAGFTLGDKIYLRDKKIGASTAIAAYPTEDNRILTALTDYSHETEAAVVYESGRDKNITFQKGEYISLGGMDFFVNPTFQIKIIEGNIFDEYEINGIYIERSSFFKTINNLCFIDGFNIEMGMYDRLFTKTLEEKVSNIEMGMYDRLFTKTLEEKVNLARAPTFAGCPYISPQDHLFSSLKRTYFFPDHKLVLYFDDRELAAIKIYKPPSDTNKGNQK